MVDLDYILEAIPTPRHLRDVAERLKKLTGDELDTDALILEVWADRCDLSYDKLSKIHGEHTVNVQETGGQPAPETVVEAMADAGQVPSWVPAFERAWEKDRTLVVKLVPDTTCGETIYKAAFLAGWIASRENFLEEHCGRRVAQAAKEETDG